MEGKIAVVTGGGSGIGRAAAERLAQRGASLVVADIDAAGAEATAERIESSGGRAAALRVDVTDPADTERMVAFATERFGGVDIAVNSAGVGGGRAKTAAVALEDWQRIIAVNLTGVWLSMRAEIPALLERGGGAIVNLASVAGVIGFPGHSPYSASKHGVVGLTRSAALEYAKNGLRVNAVCPAFTWTPMVQSFVAEDPERKERLLRGIPAGRFGTAEEVAECIAYLCSDGAGFVTGQSIVLDGGLTAG